MDRVDLAAILDGIAHAVVVQAPDGGLVYVNDAAVRMLGVPAGFPDRAALLAASPADVARRLDAERADGRPFAAAELPGRRALAGEEPEPVTLRFGANGGPPSRWVRVKAQAVYDEEGRVVRAISVVEDITDLKAAEATQRLLAEASRILAGSLDYEETLTRVAWLAVPDLADWCMVDVLGDRGLERVAVAHADPTQAEVAAALRGLIIDPGGSEGPAAVARSGRAELHPDAGPEHLRRAAVDPRHHELVTQLGVRSAAIVPMTARSQRLGVMTLSTAQSARRLGQDELTVLEELGRRAAAAIDSARLYRQRSQIARTLQASLLPPLLPEVPGVEAAAQFRPAGEGNDVGGDFYDLFTVADDEWIAVIGDVCGKGAEAAAVTALARYTIRAAAVRRRSPAAILRWLNDAMLRERPGGRFCTITCVRAGGDVCELGASGTLMGLVRDPALEDRHAELGPGDALVLYTDGVTEAHAPDRMLEPADLRALLGAMPPDASAQQLAQGLVGGALGRGERPPRDDIAVLALRARG